MRHESNTLHTLVCALIAGAAIISTAGCADDGSADPALICGAGTHADGEACVPDLACGRGTRAVDGQCVPDGSLICAQGTVYDASRGDCRIDPGSCAAGTALVAGRCVPVDETLRADAEEAPEPNHRRGEVAGHIKLPAIGAPGYVVHGCLTPNERVDGELQYDTDNWAIGVEAPTLIEITVDGVGGLVGGFEIHPLGAPVPSSWWRAGINLTGDTARRQVFLPAAGVYRIRVGDSRELLDGVAAGGGLGACYFATVAQRAMPAPQPLLASGEVRAELPTDEIRVYSLRAARGELVHAVLAMPTYAAIASMWVGHAGNFRLATETTGPDGAPAASFAVAGADDLTVIVDPVASYDVVPAPLWLSTRRLAVPALPAGGALTFAAAREPLHGPSGQLSAPSYASFEVGAHEIVHLDLECSTPCNTLVIDASGDHDIDLPHTLVAAPGSVFDFDGIVNGPGADAFEGWLALPPGRYYLGVAAAYGDPKAVKVTSRISRATIQSLTPGAPARTVAMTRGRAWFRIDPGAPSWLVVNAVGQGFTSMPVVSLFDGSRTGTINLSLSSSFYASGDELELPAAALRTEHAYLMSVSDSEQDSSPATGVSVSYRAREHVLLDRAVPGEVVEVDGAIDRAGGVRYYLLPLGVTVSAIDAAVSPSSALDVVLRAGRLGGGERDQVGPGGVERQALSTMGAGDALAVAVSGDSAGTFRLAVRAADFDAGGLTDRCKASCQAMNAFTCADDGAISVCLSICGAESPRQSLACAEEAAAYQACRRTEWTCLELPDGPQRLMPGAACSDEDEALASCLGE